MKAQKKHINIFIKYINTFPFDGKTIYFYNLIKILPDSLWGEYEEFRNWFKNNKDLVNPILTQHDHVIQKNNNKAKKAFNEYRKSLKPKFPTYANAGPHAYRGMFDET